MPIVPCDPHADSIDRALQAFRTPRIPDQADTPPRDPAKLRDDLRDLLVSVRVVAANNDIDIFDLIEDGWASWA